MRHCSTCGRTPEQVSFSKKSSSPDGLQSTCIDCQAVYRLEKRDHKAEYITQWRKDNPQKHRAIKQRRRARNRGAEGVFTDADIQSIYEQQQGVCAYCQIPLNGIYHIDHIHPLSRGGSNWPDNLACACGHCNTSKGNRLISEWKFTLDRTANG